MERFELIIIGAGPAGLSAAISAAGEGCGRILVLDRLSEPGGILTQCFHRGFRHPKSDKMLTGYEYKRWLLDSLPDGISLCMNSTALEISPDRVLTVAGSGRIYKAAAKAVVVATGCRERPVGSRPVFGSRPAGVFTAGSVQKMLNLDNYKIGKRVVVLGSGDVGLIVAHHLTEHGANVLAILEKRDDIGGLARNKRLYLDPHGIPLLTFKTVTRLLGAARLEAVEVSSVDTDGIPVPGSEYLLECDTLVTSVGLIPERELINGFSGDALPDWLFVCGNASSVHSLVDSVALEGTKTGIEATHFLSMT